MEQELTYDKAYTELKSIAQQIDSESITVDVLAQKVKRAADLIKFCQEKLRATETEVDNIIKQMETSAK
ncbi:exodeoxyribonuclease VII small subunit [Mucilaginibacter sp. McL0603]|jgi:exodeoxyribonuclease VII small subunit|uniref:exodeoxyribonuclease VII small subunit n=1 Tax=Mucilaginibacter sp. McL0603 TaxID=3415670 RepID=UPI003CF40E28